MAIEVFWFHPFNVQYLKNGSRVVFGSQEGDKAEVDLRAGILLVHRNEELIITASSVGWQVISRGE